MKHLLLLPLFLLLASACNQQQTPNSDEGPAATKVAVNVPAFNADSAYEYVKQQCDFGPRVPNTKAHTACAAWLTGKLKGYAHAVEVQQGTVQAFNGTPLNFKNIIASWNPESVNRILLCAHWDSRPWCDYDPDVKNRRKPVMGANDGASGVGVLIETARQLHARNPAAGIDIVLFDVEDYGPPQDEKERYNGDEWWGQGAAYWAANPHKPNYHARFGILLDMVGAAGATFTMECISLQYASDIMKKVWNTAARIGYSGFFLFEPGGYITDDHLHVNRIMGIPTIDIIHLDKTTETGFFPYWHTTGDTMDKIDRSTLKAVGQTLLTVIYEDR